MDLHTVKNLKLLKKLSLQKSDLLRLEMHECLSQIAQLNTYSKELIASHLREEEIAARAEHVEIAIAFAAYRAKNKSELFKTAKAASEIEKSYEILRDQLGDLFSEQKSYEITIDDLKKKQMMSDKQKEAQYFDEVSMQRWRSK
ncbi:MAG: hypothetical protein V4544_01765 [Pseudomonadota bacterium]